MERQHVSALVLGAIAATALASCSLPVPDQADDQFAQSAIDDLRRGDVAALDAISGPEIKTPTARANLEPMRAFFPKGEPTSVKREAWRANANIGQPPMLTLQEAYDYPDRVVTVEVTMSQAGGPHEWLVRGMHVNFTMKPATTLGAAKAAPT